MVQTIRVAGIASLLTCLVSSGCDPGYVYDPINPKGQIVQRWSEKVDGVSFSAGYLQILVGEKSASYGFDVANNSGKTVVILSAEFVTDGRTMEVEVDKNGPQSFPPDTSGSVYLECRFPGFSDASEVLGDTMTWTIHVRIGEKERAVRITLKRN